MVISNPFRKQVPGYESTGFRKVKTFTEKPDLELAKVFLDSGDFYWNAGIFFWSLKSIMDSFEILPAGNPFPV